MKLLRRYITAFSVGLLLIVPKKIVWGCGFYIWPGEYRFWMLQPDLSDDKELSPFYLSTNQFYPGTYQSMDNHHYEKNVQEWWQLTGKKVKKEDIYTILYETPGPDFLEELDSLAKNNTFVAFLKAPGNKDWLAYMRLSKKLESIAENPDPWEEAVYPSPAINRVIKEGNALYAATNNAVLRLRLAYQLMRLHGYNRQYAAVDTIWREKVETVKIDSWVKTAAMYTKALYEPTIRSEYLFSKVFDRGDYNRGQSLIQFRFKKWNEAIELAANKHERTVLHAMRAINYAGKTMQDIQLIYQMEPAYKELPFLLLREINKVEDWLLTRKVTGQGPAFYAIGIEPTSTDWVQRKKDQAYAAALYAFIQRLIAEKKAIDQPLLHLCAAHLAFIQGNYEQSRNYLGKAAAFPRLPAKMKTQLQVSEVLLRLTTEPVYNKQTEQKLVDLLAAPDTALGVNDPAVLKDQLALYAGKLLMRKGDKAKGLLLLGKTRRALGALSIGAYKTVYEVAWDAATGADYDSMLHMLARKQPSAFERYVSTGKLKTPFDNGNEYEAGPFMDNDGDTWDVRKLKDLQAGYYIRIDSLEKALTILKQLPDSLWKEYPYDPYLKGDPFVVHLARPHRVDSAEASFTKPRIIEQMIALKEQARRNPDKAGMCYYQLANAYYNFTYHGKHWIMFKPWWTSYDNNEYYVQNVVADFGSVYYGCTRAEEYYLKAMKATKDKKLASLCCMMAGISHENYRRYRRGMEEWNSTVKFVNPYVGILKQQKMGTDYYKEIITECDTYDQYIWELHRR